MVSVIKTYNAVNMTQPVARDLIPALLAALADLPVVVLTGMRQTGKSTLLTSTKGLSSRSWKRRAPIRRASSLATSRSRSTRFSVRPSCWSP